MITTKDLSKCVMLPDPFPHIVIDDFIPADVARAAYHEFDQLSLQTFRHFNEHKQGSNAKRTFPHALASLIGILNSPEFLLQLEALTGIRDLIADGELGSGGIHQSTRGSFLNIHADFTIHPYHPDWQRRLNLLLYLGEWNLKWGGALELWSRDMHNCVSRIDPRQCRCVIFATDADSFHGHPEPMTCPAGVYRRSIALYYYTKTAAPAIATNYRARPTDPLHKRALIFADNFAVSAFHKAKSAFGLKDSIITRFMKKS